MELNEVLLLPPDQAARYILGSSLISTIDGVATGGVITELEAYLAENDEAAHNSRGKTSTNSSLYKIAGTLYMHSMRQWLLMDIVTENIDVPSSILVRAIIPTIGVETMKNRRGEPDIAKLCNGPGKVCQALGLKKGLNGQSLLSKESQIRIVLPEKTVVADKIVNSERIGITKNKTAQLRFHLKTN